MNIQFSSFSSVAQSCLILCDPQGLQPQASLSITNSRSLLKLMSIVVMPSNHLILWGMLARTQEQEPNHNHLGQGQHRALSPQLPVCLEFKPISGK